MKLNLKTEGEVELDHKESVEAMLQYLRNEKKLLDAMNLVFGPKGVEAKKVAHSIDKDGQISFKVQVSSSKGAGLFEGSSTETTRSVTSGFVRKNVGFYRTLVDYLQEKAKKGKKRLSFDEVLEEMQDLFPDLDKRRFSIYIRDKREQKKKRFKFDGETNEFIL
jgi:hypothetical protein